MREIEPLQLLYYQTRDGRMPFREWAIAIDDQVAHAALLARLARLRLGLFGDCRQVGAGVQEMRIDAGPGYRAYFASTSGGVVLLLCGGDKRSQSRDIRQSKIYWRDYEERSRSTRGSS